MRDSDCLTNKLSPGVAAFLSKLWFLVNDQSTNELIYWASDGKSFFVKNSEKFTIDTLPHYFKHSNMASFVRQLNMYGFHKKLTFANGQKYESEILEFEHEFFVKDHPELVGKIKRKMPSMYQFSRSWLQYRPSDQRVSKLQLAPAKDGIKPDILDKMLQDVKKMRDRQENMDNTLNEVKRENSTLWRELAILRHKHIKQQQIINKLFTFLVSLVQSSRSGLSVKRRYPLMIDDSIPNKRSKSSEPQECTMGPVIHELETSDSDLYSDNIVAEMLENENPTVQSPPVQSPREHNERLVDEQNMATSVQLNKESPLHNPEIGTTTKRVNKDKKRKNMVPVRILIPSLENGKKSREELHMFEVSIDEDKPAPVLNTESINSKPIPMAAARSSKLKAMAANISSQDVNKDIDTDTPFEYDDSYNDVSYNDTPIEKLREILIIPDMFDINIHNHFNNEEDGNSNHMNERLNQTDGERSVLGSNKQLNQNTRAKASEKEIDYNNTRPSSSNDLLVSRVNSSGTTNPNYREEIDHHLETVQNSLDTLREKLYNENCSLDANTLFELFTSEDPMTFALPMNPELNPHNMKDEESDTTADFSTEATGGELMAYNSSTNLLDFDDLGNILSENASSLPDPDVQMSSLYAPDSFYNIEDTKAS
ncbi:PREDICTED: heat shock factor protein 1-like isoform X2 [Vollenhovia emeryi]|uniref:heat shock factor protein 1-like isoform X2 n=1 Tax=Vollenhovia emeryi TaxID=411798 RepID=UPI0005F3725A|nr:PREDICTED: heat shock factor protein 1-like isoform X2 [Vollenhovia emeryi]